MRSWKVAGGYRYGFNGKENDNEVKGEGNQVAFEARIYDPRVGRFLSRDPLAVEYPYQSDYVFASNSPVRLIDMFGMAPDDPPTFRDYMKTFFATASVQAGSFNNMMNDGADYVMPKLLGTGNGAIRSLSLGTINRSAEDIGLNDRYASDYSRTSDYAATVPLLARTGNPGTGAAPSLVFAKGNQLVMPKALDVSLALTSTLLATARGADVSESSEPTPKNGSTPANRAGQAKHREYKAGEADGFNTFKEYRLPSGEKNDFIDIPNGKIYELKPNNARQIRAGKKQLEQYKAELEKMARFADKVWQTILETY